MKQKYAACPICNHIITAQYRSAYCSFCSRVIAMQKKIDAWPAEKKRQELARYRRICSQISLSLSASGHMMKTSHERAVSIIRSYLKNRI